MLRKFKSDHFISAIGLTAALATIGVLNTGEAAQFANASIFARTTATTQALPQAIATALPTAPAPASLMNSELGADGTIQPKAGAIVAISPAAPPTALPIMSLTGGSRPLGGWGNVSKTLPESHLATVELRSGHPDAAPANQVVTSFVNLVSSTAVAPATSFAAPKQGMPMQMYAPLISYLEALKTCSPNTLQFGALSSQIIGWDGEHCRTESSLIGAGDNGATEAVTCLFSAADLNVLTNDAVLDAAAAQDVAALQGLTQTVQQVAEQACE